jgi:hypothetical protein
VYVGERERVCVCVFVRVFVDWFNLSCSTEV